MADICTCGHAESLHIAKNLVSTLGVRYRSCRRIGCPCTTYTPAPAGVSAAPTTRDRPIGPAGAPTSEGTTPWTTAAKFAAASSTAPESAGASDER